MMCLVNPYISGGGGDFNVTSDTGTGALHNISTGQNLGGGGMVLMTRAALTSNRALYDTVRGANMELQANSSNAETNEADSVSFNANGISMSTDANWNANGVTYRVFSWLQRNGLFGVVEYNGDGSASYKNVTNPHSLIPRMMWVKRQDAAGDWRVYHAALGATKSVILNGTAVPDTSLTYWYNYTPNTSVFRVGTALNASGAAYIAYLFAEESGSSAYGSYSGTGNSSGATLVLGFTPKAWLIRDTTGTGSWRFCWVEGSIIYAVNLQDSTAPVVSTSKFLISGGTLQITDSDANINQSGHTYIYFAWK